MSSSEGFTDSTDWLNTPLSLLKPIDAALRCQVCKDYFTTPMITSCSHTFCSLCIRRYLSQEGKCPACRESDQEIRLRRNWSIEEAVIQFKAGREDLLRFARSSKENNEDAAQPRKRRKAQHTETLPERRSTRSQSRRITSQDPTNGYSAPSTQEEIQDSDEGSAYDAQPKKKEEPEPHDGLVVCPVCDRRVKEALVNSHLDRCMAGQASPTLPLSEMPQIQSTSIAYGQTKPTQTQDRLPTLNYSMLNDSALRRKLKELGIPSHGSKELMRKRHTEWVNLWNANCDSLRPAPKSQLLRDLDRWEKTLGRQIDKGGPSGVMVKDFDRDGWQKSNKGGFDELIRKAREKRATAGNGGGTGANDERQAEVVDSVREDLPSNPPKSIEAIFGGSLGNHRTDSLTNGDHGDKTAYDMVLDHGHVIE